MEKVCFYLYRWFVDIGSDLRKSVVHMIELVERMSLCEMKENLSVLKECSDTTISQAAAAAITKME